jgi:hypothetical protein
MPDQASLETASIYGGFNEWDQSAMASMLDAVRQQ